MMARPPVADKQHVISATLTESLALLNNQEGRDFNRPHQLIMQAV